MKTPGRFQGAKIACLVVACALAGCGGSRVLKEPKPIVITQSLATASDQHVSATLDWVVVRDGDGTWAKNSYWDEYLLRISNKSGQPIRLTGLIVVDSLNWRIEAQTSRKQLVRGSKNTSRRYKESGIKISAGPGRGTMGVAAATAAGSMIGAGLGAGTIAGATGGAVVVGGLVLAPLLAVGGIVRGVNNSAVDTQIEQRQTMLPLEVTPGGDVLLDVFFPLAPSPGTVELAYADPFGEHVVLIDTGVALHGLHVESSAE
jgi:hypothetical protein